LTFISFKWIIANGIEAKPQKLLGIRITTQGKRTITLKESVENSMTVATMLHRHTTNMALVQVKIILKVAAVFPRNDYSPRNPVLTLYFLVSTPILPSQIYNHTSTLMGAA
jgi:hypothetical protein